VSKSLSEKELGEIYELLLAGKHLAVKLAETYRAAGINPKDCQAIRDWFAAVNKAEGKS
jgi:hypothetical protein